MDEYDVVAVSTGERQWCEGDGKANDFDIRQIVAQQYLAVGRREAEFRIKQDALQFRDGFAACDGTGAAAGPGGPQPLGEYQRGDDDISVENDPRRGQGFQPDWRAHRTASATSSSVIPRSASFSRTAAGAPIRAGVSTKRSPSTMTWKCDAGPRASSACLGRVSWFLEVSLTSMVRK